MEKLEVDREYTDDFRSSDDSLLGEEVVLLDMDLGDTYKIFDEQNLKIQLNNQEVQDQQHLEMLLQGLKRGKRKKNC